MSAIQRVSVETEGGRSHWLESGSGDDALVWFPALLDSAAGFGRTMLALRRKLPLVRVLAIDPPGYGEPGGDDAALLPIGGWERWCQSLARELQERCPGRIVFAGNSSGGVAATLAASAVQRCAGLVLVCWCDWRGHASPGSAVLCPRDPAGAQRLLERAWYRPPELAPATIERMLEQSRRPQFVEHVASFDPLVYREQLASFGGPLVLVGGEQDGLVPPAALTATAAARGPGRTPIHVLSECGHYPHRERQQEFAALLAAVTSGLLEAAGAIATRRRASRSTRGAQHGTELDH